MIDVLVHNVSPLCSTSEQNDGIFCNTYIFGYFYCYFHAQNCKDLLSC